MLVAVEKYPRKRKKWPWVVLVLLILPIFPVVGFYYLVHDENTKQIKVQENFTMESFGNRVLVDSLDPAKEKEKLSLSVTENDMDNILMHVLKQASAVNAFVRKAYVIINGKQYKFYVDIDAVLIKTRLIINTELIDDVEHDRFVFQVKDINMGKIGGLRNVSNSVIGRFINQDNINAFLASSGMSLTYSKEDHALFYNKSDLIKDMSSMASGSSDSLYMTVVESLFDEKVFSFNPNTNNFIDADVDLKKLEKNELVTDTPEQIVLTPDKVGTNVRDKLVTLINDKAVEPGDQMNLAFKYLFHGYEHISEEEKGKVLSIDFSSIGMADQDAIKAYKGFSDVLNDGDTDLVKKMEEKIVVANLLLKDSELGPGEEEKNKYLCSLDENDINGYVKGRNVVGYTSLLHRQAENTYKVNYITIDNFYTNVYRDEKDTAEFVAKVNINGCHTSLTFSSAVHDVITDNNMIFNIDQVKYGEIGAEKMKKELLKIIQDALQGGDKSISADMDKSQFAFNFDSIIAKAKEKIKAGLDEKHIPYTEEQIDNAFVDNILISNYGEDRDAIGGIKLTLRESVMTKLGIA